MIRYTLSKSERLSSESRIDVLFNKGRRGSSGPLKYCFLVSQSPSLAHTPDAAVSVLFSVPKKAFRMAWKRNLLKRRMRESYRLQKHKLIAAVRDAGIHIDIALVCFPQGIKGAKTAAVAIEIPDFKTIDDAIAKILEKILEKIPRGN